MTIEETWKVERVADYAVDGELFRAIIVTENGHQLIAQCPSIGVADLIVSIHEGYTRLANAIGEKGVDYSKIHPDDPLWRYLQ